ncbi:hypothetical protein [Aureliella helgolandensis]|uniref:Uncharacterized protein n=1 Tax=Aureliella helgolandensis TaxID=2527968 RepID=A0A518G4S0_9BACT|nr:hypothetical protein [Aureliella helgolandensis]QDV23595.1 hypothetical protein Q31a_18970 [Aureliella helgolandensis]
MRKKPEFTLQAKQSCLTVRPHLSQLGLNAPPTTPNGSAMESNFQDIKSPPAIPQ